MPPQRDGVVLPSLESGRPAQNDRTLPDQVPARQWTVRPVPLATGIALVLALVYLAAPLTGQDLSAQIAHADFARAHPLTPVDLRWFGGYSVFGYSLWVPLLMAWAGVRLVGAVCSVVATALTTAVFVRAGAPRPWLGGVFAALTQTANLVVGRISFAVGMVCGLAAVLVLVPRSRSGSCRPSDTMRSEIAAAAPRNATAAAVLALLAGAASPVAALLLWVCGTTALLRRRWRTGLLLLAASALPVVVIAWCFGNGGTEPFDGRDARDTLIASALVVVLLPARAVALRVGALVGIALVVAAFVVPSPVGNNAARLSMLFAVPIVAAFVAWRRTWPVIAAAVLVAWPQQLALRYAFSAGPAASPAYYTPLVAQVHERGRLTGRVEVPETSAHWDAAFLARSVPLARGWLRQLDVALNGAVFFHGSPGPGRYRHWLAANAVQWVAVPDVKLSVEGDRERALVTSGLPYLREVWHGAHWQLFAVRHRLPVVARPGRLKRYSPDQVDLRAPARSTILVRVRWSPLLSLDSTDPAACIAPRPAGGVVLHTGRGGRYLIGSALPSPGGHCH